MWTEPFWVNCTFPGRLAVSPRPRGDDWLGDEIRAWRSAGVDMVVSLLRNQEAESLGLDREPEICRSAGIEYRTLPIVDRSVPESVREMLKLVDEVLTRLHAGKNVVIHCRQGIGRSGLLATAILIRSGNPLEAAIQLVSDVRGVKVPETEEQLEWIRSFA